MLLAAMKCMIALLFISSMSVSQFIAPTELKYLWITPIQISSLIGHSSNVRNSTSIDPFTLTNSFISDLAELQWFHFQDFCSDNALLTSYKKKYDLHDDASLSDVFYFYQLDSFEMLMGDVCIDSTCKSNRLKYKETKKMYSKLIEIFGLALDHYFLSNGLPSIQFDSRKVSLWTSIHLNGTFHQAHHHEGNILSGVLYLRVPEASGKLVFEDPRGALPPFGRTHRIAPVVGDLVLFPSWLVHRVEPTWSPYPRISVSFNYGDGSVGSTAVTGDISRGLRTI